MKKEPALIIIKPDGISKGLTGAILTKFSQTNLEIIGTRILMATRELAQEHYKHVKDAPFFDDMINYFMGKYHKQKKLLAIIYYGENAIRKCRKIAGATNPEEADPSSIRGSYGRITTRGTFENVVHVSSDKAEAEREIKIWFNPDDVLAKLYPSKLTTIEAHKERVWA